MNDDDDRTRLSQASTLAAVATAAIGFTEFCKSPRDVARDPVGFLRALGRTRKKLAGQLAEKLPPS